MKAITCEMCGSTDILKQEGVFVCQTCGTKYSVEDAKKMMVEGIVEVTGTVRVDNSIALEKALKSARRARDDDNAELAERFYADVLAENPDSWEGIFYNTYFKVMQCKIANISSAANSLSNCIDTVVDRIKGQLNEQEQILAITDISKRLINISQMFWINSMNSFTSYSAQGQSAHKSEFIDTVFAITLICKIFGDEVDRQFDGSEWIKPIVVSVYEAGIAIHFHCQRAKYVKPEYLDELASKLRKYKPEYVLPKQNKGPCYVATAVYGSYDCPQVWTLRRYRDYTLAENAFGRAFIRTYYAISPSLVKWFGETSWFKKLWRGQLDSLVAKLRERGIEDTEYEDRFWR